MDFLPIRGGCKDVAEFCPDILFEFLNKDGYISTVNDCRIDDTLDNYVDKS